MPTSFNRSKTNISLQRRRTTFAHLNEDFKDIIRIIGKGDTRFAEGFFRKPGGRKYLENITLILINTLPQHYGEKEDLYLGFIKVLDLMEQRIKRQQEGQDILDDVFAEE